MKSELAYNLYHHIQDFIKEINKDGFYVTKEGHVKIKRRNNSHDLVGYIIQGTNFPPHLIITSSYEREFAMQNKENPFSHDDSTLRDAYSRLRKIAEEFDSAR